jgi:HK97 family phage major capsid protein
MGAKERKDALLKELDGLAPKVDTGDSKAAARANEIMEKEIPAVDQQLAALEKSKAILGGLSQGGSSSLKTDNEKSATLGEMAVKAVRAYSVSPKERRFTISTPGIGLKASTDVNTSPASDYAITNQEIRPDILEGYRRPLTVADLFSSETTDEGAVTYFVEGAVEGEPGQTAEGETYGQLHFADPEEHTDSLKKTTAMWKDTDELLSDSPRLAQSINNRGPYLMDIKEEDQIVAGDGTGQNQLGLLNRDGIQTATYADFEALLKAIKHAKVLVRKGTPGFRADGVLINDEDWDELTNLQDANKQFLAGGPFYGQYGTGAGPSEEPPLWSLHVVPTPAIAAGTIVVGAFKLGGSVIRHRTGRMLEMTNSDGQDFEKGIVTFRTSERLALAIRYPGAFVKLTKASA